MREKGGDYKLLLSAVVLSFEGMRYNRRKEINFSHTGVQGLIVSCQEQIRRPMVGSRQLVYKLSERSYNISSGLSAGKPLETMAYCFHDMNMSEVCQRER